MKNILAIVLLLLVASHATLGFVAKQKVATVMMTIADDEQRETDENEKKQTEEWISHFSQVLTQATQSITEFAFPLLSPLLTPFIERLTPPPDGRHLNA